MTFPGRATNQNHLNTQKDVLPVGVVRNSSFEASTALPDFHLTVEEFEAGTFSDERIPRGTLGNASNQGEREQKQGVTTSSAEQHGTPLADSHSSSEEPSTLREAPKLVPLGTQAKPLGHGALGDFQTEGHEVDSQNRLIKAECVDCGVEFQHRAHSPRDRCITHNTVFQMMRNKKKELVAPGAHPGETVEEYLDRADMEVWNMGAVS